MFWSSIVDILVLLDLRLNNNLSIISFLLDTDRLEKVEDYVRGFTWRLTNVKPVYSFNQILRTNNDLWNPITIVDYMRGVIIVFVPCETPQSRQLDGVKHCDAHEFMLVNTNKLHELPSNDLNYILT